MDIPVGAWIPCARQACLGIHCRHIVPLRPAHGEKMSSHEERAFKEAQAGNKTARFKTRIRPRQPGSRRDVQGGHEVARSPVDLAEESADVKPVPRALQRQHAAAQVGRKIAADIGIPWKNRAGHRVERREISPWLPRDGGEFAADIDNASNLLERLDDVICLGRPRGVQGVVGQEMSQIRPRFIADLIESSADIPAAGPVRNGGVNSAMDRREADIGTAVHRIQQGGGGRVR